MQTYKCHEAAVRYNLDFKLPLFMSSDTCFSRKGERIATASFDKFSRVMDTETGICSAFLATASFLSSS